MAVVVFVIGAIVGMAVLIFAYENQEPVTLRYLFTWQMEPIPLFAVIMASVGVGFVIASLFGLAAYLRARKIIRQQRRTIADLHAELHTLRTLPLEAPSGAGGALRGSDTPAPSAGELSPR
ncbi:MAG: LapA family protein [Candidatus Entotheonellia bacterium]